jgi:hypothetical protein
MSDLLASDLMSFFSSEPMILLLGNNLDMQKHKKITDCPWNCVYTSSRDESSFVTYFSNHERVCRNIVHENELRGNMMDRRNLKIVRLFGTDTTLEQPQTVAERRAYQRQITRFLDKICKLIEYTGYLVIDGFIENDLLSLDAIGDLIAQLRNGSVLFFGVSDQNMHGELKDVFKEKGVHTFSVHLSEFLESLQMPNEDDEEIYESRYSDVENVQLYINGKIHNINRQSFQRLNTFAQILTKSEVMGRQIPPYLNENYFYLFMKESSIAPQWYGYSAGFYIKRYFDVNLLETIRRDLINSGDIKQKPVMILGQTGSGKSVSVASLAYNIFAEKQFPVIFINRDVDFMPIIKSQNGKIIDRHYSPQFEALDETLQYLEKKGARSILIVWDLSVFIREREKYVHLYNALRSRGRNIQLVCTAYEFSNPDDIIAKNFNTKFKIDIQLRSSDTDDNDDELGRFRTILERKARMSADQIEEIISFINNDREKQNLLALFYIFFYALRPGIALGVYKEATKTVKEIFDSAVKQSQALVSRTAIAMALERAGIIQSQSINEFDVAHEDLVVNSHIEQFLCLTAICSKFGFGIPSSLALRISKAYDMDSIRMIRAIPFFECLDISSGDFSYRIRTKIEAEILLQYFHISPEKEIDLITNLISEINFGNDYSHLAEVKLVSDILYNIGPNSNNRENQKRFSPFYPKIIVALANIRKNAGDYPNPNLVLQEVNYIREYYARRDRYIENQDSEQLTDIVNYLLEAIRIADETITLMNDDYPLAIKDMLLVEVSTSRIRLCEIAPGYTIKQCERAKSDVKSIWSHNPDNAYSYTAWIKAAKIEYEYCKDEVKKVQLLAEMCNVIDRVRTEKPDVAQDRYFYEPADDIYSILEDGKADKYFDELIEAGSYAGIYIRAYKWLNDAGIKDMREPIHIASDVSILNKICNELLENPRYNYIVLSSPECQYLLLRLKWLIYNKEPLFYNNSQFTYMGETAWLEIKEICEQYQKFFIDQNIIDGYIANTIIYILALSCAQLKDYESCIKIIPKLRRGTEWWNSRFRILTRYFICDSNGKPLEYNGEFLNIAEINNDQGYILIYDISQYMPNGKNGIYYHRRNIKGITIEKGVTSTKFQIGLGYMGFRVYHGEKGPHGE